MGNAVHHTKTCEPELSYFEHELAHSRTRIYPRTATAVIALTDGGADTYGAWTVCIPVNTIDFPYDIIEISSEGTTAPAAETYIIQFADSATPSALDYVGEARYRLGTGGRSQVKIRGKAIAANGGLWARMQTASGGITANISLKIIRHLEWGITVPQWPDWPW